jgi:hypothetical protein
MSEGLTMNRVMAMDFVQLARIVINESMSVEDRRKAANGLHARAPREMNGAGWLALYNDEKALVRKALEFDTTGEGFHPLDGRA